MPPSNITVNCDEIKNDCIIQWQRPQISHSNKDNCFRYEINVNYKVRLISSPTFSINTCICFYHHKWIKGKQSSSCVALYSSAAAPCRQATMSCCPFLFIPVYACGRRYMKHTGWVHLHGTKRRVMLINELEHITTRDQSQRMYFFH